MEEGFEVNDKDDVRGSRRCLVQGTHILMSDGSVKLIENIKVGDNIMAWDGSRFVPDAVENVWESGDKEIVQLSHPGMPDIYSTIDHIFAVTIHCKARATWKPLVGIADKDFVLAYGGSSHGPIKDPLLGEFLGHFLFGGASQDNYEVKHNRYEQVRLKLFERDGVMPESKMPDSLRQSYQLDRDSLVTFMGAVITMRGRIIIIRCPFERDEIDYRSAVAALEVLVIWEKMAWDIYWLLRKLSMSPRPPFKRETHWCVKIGRGEDIKVLLESDAVVGHGDMVAEALNTIEQCKSGRARMIYNGCFRMRVKKYKLDMRPTYDIKTAVYHNYVANGYVVHNSGE